MQKDKNYNITLVLENGKEEQIYSQKLHNDDLDYWQGWQCKSGVDSIYIYGNTIFGGECRNDKLGEFGNWHLLEDWTQCRQKRCSGCTIDLLQEKQSPNY